METKEEINNLSQNYKDVSNQDLFKNHVLCAQFLRDYSNCKAFANVQPEDIEDISERFTQIEGDTVKQIRLKDAQGRESRLPDRAHVVMQLLHYISNIWRDYARSSPYQTEGVKMVEVNKVKSFRYPPILPIVYYEGKKKWTAGMHLRNRIQQVERLEEFIPDFAYRLVRIHDYSNTDLLDRADEMSLIMLLNKIQTPEDLQGILNISGAEDSAENVMTIIRDAVYLLCRKMNLPTDKTKELLSQIKKGRNMGYLFENMEHMDIQAAHQGRINAEKERDDVKRKLDDMEQKLNNTEGKLDEAHKNYLRLCKKCSLDKENAVTELLKDDTLTQENAWEIVNRY